jgi:transcriptional regulator with XRE-family HTH domain
MTIEERIQELRKCKGLSQEQLADALGVSRQAVSKWEGGQSLPELEKIIAMSSLFEVTTDYILKGESTQGRQDKHRSALLGSQIISAVAAMMLAIAIAATLGQLSDGVYTVDIYGGLIVESVGIMLLLVGFFLAGSRVLNKPLYIANILMAGVLPASFAVQTFVRYKPSPTPAFHPATLLLFAVTYLLICGLALFFGLLRKKK